MKIILVSSALLATLALPAYAQEDGPVQTFKSDEAAIKAVTVNPDGATVTRRVKVKTTNKRGRVAFLGLTAGLDEASLRAKVAGGSIKVSGISAEWEGNVEPAREAVKKLETKVEELQTKIQSENDALQALSVRHAVLEQYRALSKEALANQASESGPATAKWKAALSYVTKEQEQISAAERKHRLEIRDLGEKLNAANAELGKLRAPSERLTRKVEVELESDGASAEGELALEYSVRDARWYPAYDVREDGDGKKVSFTYYGTVTQATGEDWKDIDLTLSTAKPTESAQVPQLRAVQLSGYKREKRPVRIVSYGKEAEKKRADSPAGPVSGGESGRAEIDDRGLAVTFAIKGKESLPADRRPHKVEVTTTLLDAKLGYEAIPKISPWVYLKATARNSTPFPILAGEVDVFRSSGYVGTGSLEYIAPGEEFAVSLGVDEDLKVKRVIDERVSTAPKLLGSTKTIAYGYTLEVSNFKTGPQSITVVENIPVSQRKEIKVSVREGTTKPDEKNDDGFLKWNVQLSPGEQKTVMFGYVLEAPESFQINGL